MALVFATAMESKSKQDAKQQRGAQALFILVFIAAFGLALILIFSSKASSTLSVFSVASMVAAGSLLGGGLFGFLFGIPRTLQQQRDGEQDGATKQNADGQASTYAPNTNLEQISDWLTKILVGAGLIQLTKLRQFLGDAAAYLAPGFGGGDSGRVFALATILSYVLLGFLVGYLWTRLYFAGALRAADVAALAREIKEIRDQNDLDAKALALAMRQMNPSGEKPVPSQKELDDAIEEASKAVKTQVFYQAQALRTENWFEQKNKAKMERTIPIFEALVHSDKGDEYHQNYAQLGYALKDSRIPNWEGSEAALSKAIHIRGSWQENQWISYEFNRAICRIMLDDPRQERPSSAEARRKIVEDLQAVFSTTPFITMGENTPEIMKWIEVNKITKDELRPKRR
jgi:hypothetical protein